MCANCCTQNSSLHRCLVHLATDSMTLTRASVDSARMKWTVRPLRKQANADLCCRTGSLCLLGRTGANGGVEFDDASSCGRSVETPGNTESTTRRAGRWLYRPTAVLLLLTTIHQSMIVKVFATIRSTDFRWLTCHNSKFTSLNNRIPRYQQAYRTA